MSTDEGEYSVSAPKAEDGEGLITRTRLTAILQARQHYEDTVENVSELEAFGELDRRSADTIIRAALARYIREIEPDLQKTDVGDKYWEEEPEKTLSIAPPSPMQMCVEAERQKMPSGWSSETFERFGNTPREMGYEVVNSNDLKPRKIKLNGLRSILKTDDPIQATYTVKLRSLGGEPTTVSRTYTSQIPRTFLHECFEAANDFLDEIGIGVKLLEHGDAEYTYDHLLP